MCLDSQSRRGSSRDLGTNGQFASVSHEGRSAEQIMRANLYIERTKRYLTSKRDTSDGVYDGILTAVFVKDPSRKRFVPAASRVGPLREMVKRLFRKKFVVSVNRQSLLTRARYFNGPWTGRPNMSQR